MSTNNKWQALSMSERAFLIREAVRNGITDINSIRDTWEHRFDGLQDVVEKVNTSDKDFARRLRQEGRASIPDWEDSRRIATHKLSVTTDDNGIHYIYPEVQNIKGQLRDFTDPKIKGHGYGDVIAAERGDTIQIGNTNRDLRNAIKFTKNYKKLGVYPEFSAPPHTFDGESNQPSEDEYIAQRAKEKRVGALNRARVAKDIPEIFVEKGWKLQERDNELYNQAVSNLNSLKQEYQNLMIKKLSPNVKGPLSTQDQIDIDYLESTIPKVEEHLKYCKTRRDDPKTSGATCINTVTGYYDRNETWNERFAKQTHGELGFRKISDKEIEPGDIVQFGEAIQNPNTGEWEIQNPGHALMANTKYNADSSNMRWNGSNGDSGEGAVRINSIYPSDWETMQAYRFVGNKADSLQWKKEYRKKYGHQFSGDGPNIFTDAWNAIKSGISLESPESKITTNGPVDLDEIKRRQAWAESKFSSKAKSKAGAKGTFQIMDAVKADYIKAGGKDGDLYDPVYNEKVRDWLFTNLGTRQWVTKGDPSDSVKVGKQLAAYNAGPGPLLKGLNKAKAQGIDIYKSFDWVNTDYIPEETVDYVNWILRNKPTGVHRNDSVYNLNKHKYKKNKK